jgi:CRP/FNR family transcriptional regulator
MSAGLAFHNTYSFSLEAVTEVSVCRFPRLKLENLFKEIPKLEDKLLGMLSNELKEAQDQMMLLARKSPKERLASFILNLSKRNINNKTKGLSFDFPMSLVDISDYLGLTIETVSRTLTHFSKEEMIALEGRKKVEILNLESLEELASGNLD